MIAPAPEQALLSSRSFPIRTAPTMTRRRMKRRPLKTSILVAAALVGLTSSVWAQQAATFRRFTLNDGEIYLDGNSLGALPAHVAERMQHVIREEWGRGLIRSWNDARWIDLPQRVGGRIARLIGAAADEVVAGDSTSLNLYKLLVAAMRMRPGRRVILTTGDDFPTDLYIAQGVA